MGTLILNITDTFRLKLPPNRQGTRFKAFMALGLVSFFWGTTWLASRQGVQHMPALQMAGLRQFMGGCVYLVFFMTKGRAWPKGREWRPILVLSLLNFMLSNGLATWGVSYITGGLASIIGSIFPLWLVILGLFRSRRLPAAGIWGILLGFGGICIIFYEHIPDFLNPKFSLGIILSIIATWAWALGSLYTKKQSAGFNPYFSIGLQMLISGSVLFTVSAATGHSIPVSQIPWQSWAAMSYLVVFGSVISFIAYLYALQNLPTELVSIYAYINPIVAVILGSVLFEEKLTVFIAVGVAVVLYGVFLVNQAYRKAGKASQTGFES